MSDTVTIRNKSAGTREIDDVGVCEPGGTIDVPAELADGTPATGTEKLEDGSFDPTGAGYHPGVSGLLAQTDVWEKATKRTTSTTSTTSAPSGEEA